LGSAAVFTADASYFYNPSAALGINHEQPFFVVLGLLCGLLGTLEIQFQKRINTWKKNNGKLLFFRINWLYTLGMCFMINNIIYFTRLMQSSDKLVINAMIGVDKSLA